MHASMYSKADVYHKKFPVRTMHSSCDPITEPQDEKDGYINLNTGTEEHNSLMCINWAHEYQYELSNKQPEKHNKAGSECDVMSVSITVVDVCL